MNIAILVPICSRNQNHEIIDDIPFLKKLYPSFQKTREDQYSYTFYLGYDDDDQFYINHSEKLKEIIPDIFCLAGCQSAPATAWNKLADIAFETGKHDYFFQVGDDVILETYGWTSHFISKLKEHNDFGVVGPCNLQNYNDRIKFGNPMCIENSFVSKKHMKIFGYYFYPKIKNYYCDDWITRVYEDIFSEIQVDYTCVNSLTAARYIPVGCNNIYQYIHEGKQLIKQYRSLKIYFHGFWNNFLNKELNIFLSFFSKVFNEDLELTDIMEDGDILVECLWKTESLIDKKEWKYTFLYTGEGHYLNWWGNRENPLEKYSCVLGFNKTSNNYVCFPFFVPYIQNNLSYEPVKEVPQNIVCAVISNYGGYIRNKFLEETEKKCSVAYGGSYKNNIGGKIQGDWDGINLINFYKQFKFVICMENEQQDYYITEKVINGFRAGVIPIYWGSPNISKYFNSRRFLCIENEESIENVIDKMLNMTDEEYLDIVNQPIFLKDDYLSEIIEDTKSCLNI
jgi:hypothetical protein